MQTEINFEWALFTFSNLAIRVEFFGSYLTRRVLYRDYFGLMAIKSRIESKTVDFFEKNSYVIFNLDIVQPNFLISILYLSHLALLTFLMTNDFKGL